MCVKCAEDELRALVRVTWAAGLSLVSGTSCDSVPLSESLDSACVGRSYPCVYTPDIHDQNTVKKCLKQQSKS